MSKNCYIQSGKSNRYLHELQCDISKVGVCSTHHTSSANILVSRMFNSLTVHSGQQTQDLAAHRE